MKLEAIRLDHLSVQRAIDERGRRTHRRRVRRDMFIFFQWTLEGLFTLQEPQVWRNGKTTLEEKFYTFL